MDSDDPTLLNVRVCNTRYLTVTLEYPNLFEEDRKLFREWGTLASLSTFFPLSMFFAGSFGMTFCHGSTMIPVYLLVGGIMGCLYELFRLFTFIKGFGITMTLGCFLIIWFLLEWSIMQDMEKSRSTTDDNSKSKDTSTDDGASQKQISTKGESELSQTREETPKTEVAKAGRWIRKNFKFPLIFIIGMHVAQVVIGAMNMHKCPVEPDIPIFLMVIGIIGIIGKGLHLLHNVAGYAYIRLNTIINILYTVELVFFILGAYWVLKEYEPTFDPAYGELYCNKTLYLFSLVYVGFVISLTILCVSLICCFLCCAIAAVVSNETKETDKSTGKNLDNKKEPKPTYALPQNIV